MVRYIGALAELGFTPLETDHAVFHYRIGQDIVILAIHVDDCTITGTSAKLQQEFKARIGSKFKLTDLGPISWLLGMQVTRDRPNRTLSLSQHAYIDTIIDLLDMVGREETLPASALAGPPVSVSLIDYLDDLAR